MSTTVAVVTGLAGLAGFLLSGGLATAGLVLIAVRCARSRRSRRVQLSRVAAMLDGRPSTHLPKLTTALAPRDLARLAHSHGYRLVDSRCAKDYRFVRTP